MAAPYGGETPLAYQDGKLTVEPPDGVTTAAPVLPGSLYKLAIAGDTAVDGSAYKAIACTDDDTPASVILVQALHRHTTMDQMGVIVLNPYAGMVRRIPYKSGAAPTLGQSIKISSELINVEGTTWARGAGTVMAIDTVALEVEVLFG
jgi:hypothetical protein